MLLLWNKMLQHPQQVVGFVDSPIVIPDSQVRGEVSGKEQAAYQNWTGLRTMDG